MTHLINSCFKGGRNVDINNLKNTEHQSAKAIDCIKKLCYTYLVKQDFHTCTKMLHPNITWIGTAAHEVVHDYHEAILLIEKNVNVQRILLKL